MRIGAKTYKHTAILILMAVAFILGALYGKIQGRLDCNEKIRAAERRGYELGRRVGGNKCNGQGLQMQRAGGSK